MMVINKYMFLYGGENVINFEGFSCFGNLFLSCGAFEGNLCKIVESASHN